MDILVFVLTLVCLHFRPKLRFCLDERTNWQISSESRDLNFDLFAQGGTLKEIQFDASRPVISKHLQIKFDIIRMCFWHKT